MWTKCFLVHFFFSYRKLIHFFRPKLAFTKKALQYFFILTIHLPLYLFVGKISFELSVNNGSPGFRMEVHIMNHCSVQIEYKSFFHSAGKSKHNSEMPERGIWEIEWMEGMWERENLLF